MKPFQKLLSLILIKSRSINQKRLVILLSLLVGVLCGLAAVILKNTVHFLHNWVAGLTEEGSFNYLYLALPGIGIILTVMYVRYFVRIILGMGFQKSYTQFRKEVVR